MSTTVIGPGLATFYWKVSSEFNADYLEFQIDGVLQPGKISGTVVWEEKTFSLPLGNHTLAWVYRKNGSSSAGSDCGWLDKVMYGWFGDGAITRRLFPKDTF